MSLKKTNEPSELCIQFKNPFKQANDLEHRCYYLLNVLQERTQYLSFPAKDDPYLKYYINLGLKALPYLLDWIGTRNAVDYNMITIFYGIVGEKGPERIADSPWNISKRIMAWATVGSGVPILYGELAKQMDESGFEYFSLHPAYKRVLAQGPKVARYLKKEFKDYSRPDYQREWRVEAYNDIKASAYSAGFTVLLYDWLSEVIDNQSSWNKYPTAQLAYYRIVEFGKRGLQLIGMDLRKPITPYQRGWREEAAAEIRKSLSGR